MAITVYSQRIYRGHSEDTKPEAAPNGSVFEETDTGDVFTKQSGSWVESGNGGVTFTVSRARVFSGASPTSWTDLDLSGTVGATSALVMLRIHAGGDMNAVAVRMNGDTVDYYDPSAEASASGVALAHHDSTAALVLMVVTDTTGVIEWITETSQADATVDVIAYVK